MIYVLDYQLILPSSLPLAEAWNPLSFKESYPMTVFAEDTQSEAEYQALEEDLILPIEGAELIWVKAADNILLNIPLKVLTRKEEAESFIKRAMIRKSWQKKITKLKRLRKKENSPFAGLKVCLRKNEARDDILKNLNINTGLSLRKRLLVLQDL